MTIARGSLLVVALAACAWFGLGAMQAIDTNRATAILSSSAPLTSASATHVDSLLSSAATLNPDRTVDLLRGQLASQRGQPARAIATIEGVTRSEPDNIEAWVALARAALHHSNAAIERAVANIGRLDPRGR